MKNRTIRVSLGLVCAVAALQACFAEPAAGKTKMTPAERRAHRQAYIASQGGWVDRPVAGRVLRIKLETDKLTKNDLKRFSDNFSETSRLAVEVLAKGETSTNTVGALIQIAEKGKDAPMLLCAPEDNWATINLTRLWEDNPDAETAMSRVTKEVWRAVAYALGGANSSQQPCVMRTIHRARDLDAEKVEMLTPPPFMAMKQTATEMEFGRYMKATYRKACQAGWAPAPTNDMQKAIWKEIHTPPEAPLQLKK